MPAASQIIAGENAQRDFGSHRRTHHTQANLFVDKRLRRLDQDSRVRERFDRQDKFSLYDSNSFIAQGLRPRGE